MKAEKKRATPTTHELMNGTRAQNLVQELILNMLDQGWDKSQALQMIVIPAMLLDEKQTRRCGKHSGIPNCCTDYFLDVVGPSVICGEPVPQDAAGVEYVRCPACRQANRVAVMKACDCFYFVTPSNLKAVRRSSRQKALRPKKAGKASGKG